MQAYKTLGQIEAINRRIQDRMAGAQWQRLMRGNTNPVDPNSVDWDVPYIHGLVTEDDKREASFLASQTLHYLRSSLDQLVYNVSWVDVGSQPAGTQFPIVHDEARWGDKQVLRQLGGMSTEHSEWIRAVQPFSGETWTVTLQNLSNADKHRVGVEVSPTMIYDFDPHSVTSDNQGGLTAQLRAVRLEFLLPSLTPSGDLPKLFDAMVVGTGQLMNKFLSEAGVPLIQIEKNPASIGSG